MLTCFEHGTSRSAVALPFDLDQRLASWAALRPAMARQLPAAFSRDEWAYLISFLAPDNLMRPFEQTFGQPLAEGADTAAVDALFRPRREVAVWLPNNVSLLGPLVLVLVSLTGARITMKAGSRADDLCQAFLSYARQHLPAGDLKNHLHEEAQVRVFDRHDPANATLSAAADVRIVFGSDEAVAAIAALPHPAGSVLVPFGDHQSEAWAEVAALDDTQLQTLAKVFAIYGTAGCTSPRRLRLIDADLPQALTVRDRLAALWPSANRQDVPMHVASQNIAARQVAAAQGWEATLTPRHAAMLAVGSDDLPAPIGLTSLCIVPTDRAALQAQLPANLQTVGHALRDARHPHWLAMLANSPVKRFVPLAQMHHFGAVWDGSNFWRNLFEQVDVAK